MKYIYIITKLRLIENKKEQINISDKLFNDYKRKQELINQLQQQYASMEGEKYTFFPIINNYIIKYKNPCIINNKYAVTEYNNNILNKKNSFSYYNNTFNKTFDIKTKEKNRYNKRKKIKRIKLINYNNNSRKYIIVPKKNFNNTFKLSKTESNLYKTKKRETNLKSLIQEEKIKNKKMSKKLSYNASSKNTNKILNSLFSIDKDKRIKTESSFILTRDESNFFSDKSNNNLKFQAESSSSYDNINLLLKKINEQKNRQIKDYKKIYESRNKIVKINISKSNDKIYNKRIYKNTSFDNYNFLNK